MMHAQSAQALLMLRNVATTNYALIVSPLALVTDFCVCVVLTPTTNNNAHTTTHPALRRRPVLVPSGSVLVPSGSVLVPSGSVLVSSCSVFYQRQESSQDVRRSGSGSQAPRVMALQYSAVPGAGGDDGVQEVLPCTYASAVRLARAADELQKELDEATFKLRQQQAAVEDLEQRAQQARKLADETANRASALEEQVRKDLGCTPLVARFLLQHTRGVAADALDLARDGDSFDPDAADKAAQFIDALLKSFQGVNAPDVMLFDVGTTFNRLIKALVEFNNPTNSICLVYHYTDNANIKLIADNGFQIGPPSTGNVFGPGVYVSPHPQAFSYCGNTGIILVAVLPHYIPYATEDHHGQIRNARKHPGDAWEIIVPADRLHVLVPVMTIPSFASGYSVVAGGCTTACTLNSIFGACYTPLNWMSKTAPCRQYAPPTRTTAAQAAGNSGSGGSGGGPAAGGAASGAASGGSAGAAGSGGGGFAASGAASDGAAGAAGSGGGGPAASGDASDGGGGGPAASGAASDGSAGAAASGGAAGSVAACLPPQQQQPSKRRRVAN